MSISSPVEPALIDRFLAALQDLPDARAEIDSPMPTSEKGNERFDAWIDLQIAGRRIPLLIQIKKAIYPRDVRQVLWELKAAHLGRGGHAQPLLIAEFLSPGAKELLRAERVGYYDSGGSLYLPATGAYVFIDKPPPKPFEKAARTLFSGRRAQVLHALLIHHREWLGVTEVADRALVAPSTASGVMSELERFDWVQSRGQGPSKERLLREPGALLDAWGQQFVSQRAQTLRRYYVPALKTDTLLEKFGRGLEEHHVEYAVSYEAAAQRYSPFLSSISQTRVRVLQGSGVEEAMATLDARVVNEGANLGVIETRSMGDLLFRQNLGGVWVASPIQVYLDLLRSEGRAKEMAEHLRRERIGF